MTGCIFNGINFNKLNILKINGNGKNAVTILFIRKTAIKKIIYTIPLLNE